MKEVNTTFGQTELESLKANQKEIMMKTMYLRLILKMVNQ